MAAERDLIFMKLALEQAEEAAAIGEVPIGAVVVRGNEVVSVAHNLRETEKNALFHAELLAIDRACKKLGGWRLHECELYVTLEPCPMCAGAMINARIKRVVYGAEDPKAGCCGTLLDLFDCGFNHRPAVERGVLQEESAKLLRAFFKKLRNRS
ncbi:MAG: nucleoside deaminase [Oscillospiraceae bacterium]|jgi:tRNA(adenine34) deaminase